MPKDATVSKEEPEAETAKRTRKTSSIETVVADYDNLLSMIEEEIKTLKAGTSLTKSHNVKFLRTLYKNIETLKTHTIYISKHTTKQPKQPRQVTGVTGFQKPVKISKEMAKFIGWKEDEMHSRGEVTKYICDYISEHELQNKTDRRFIDIDYKLQKLFGLDSDNPIRYCDIQTRLKTQNHFPKDE